MSTAHPHFIITLVYGTFSNNAEWIQVESAFAKEISKNINRSSTLFSFNWSGKNSHSARLKAGHELAEHLTKLHSKYPYSEQIIIAHSHGGNVAMYAIKQLGIPPFTFKIITMATPFLNISLRNLNSIFIVFPLAATIAFIAPLSIALPIAISVLIFHYLSYLLPLGYGWITIVLSFISSFFLIIIITIPFIVYTYTYLKSYKDILDTKSKKLMTEISINGYSHYKCLSVTFAGDEAKIWLQSSIIINNLPVFLYKTFNYIASFVINRWKSILLLAFTLFLIAGTADKFLRESPKGYEYYYMIILMALLYYIPTYLASALISLLPIIYFIALFSKSNPFVFGWESILHIFLIKTRVNVTPSHLTHCYYKIYKSQFQLIKRRNIKHSLIYSDSHIISEIADWISKS